MLSSVLCAIDNREEITMEFSEVVLSRRSIRLFLPDPVPRETIIKMVELARWAPSWGNTQPWELVVADGEKCKELARLFEAEFKSEAPSQPDVEMPAEFPELHKQRYTDLGKELLTFMDINRADKAARHQHYVNMYKFFGAPAVIYIIMDSSLSVPYACLDIGSIGTILCYAAMQEGLGSIYLASSARYPEIVRRVLDIPADKKIVIGIAVGYPHPTDPAGTFRSARASLGEILKFA
jgi:nitroreductase